MVLGGCQRTVGGSAPPGRGRGPPEVVRYYRFAPADQHVAADGHVRRQRSDACGSPKGYPAKGEIRSAAAKTPVGWSQPRVVRAPRRANVSPTNKHRLVEWLRDGRPTSIRRYLENPRFRLAVIPGPDSRTMRTAHFAGLLRLTLTLGEYRLGFDRP